VALGAVRWLNATKRYVFKLEALVPKSDHQRKLPALSVANDPLRASSPPSVIVLDVTILDCVRKSGPASHVAGRQNEPNRDRCATTVGYGIQSADRNASESGEETCWRGLSFTMTFLTVPLDRDFCNAQLSEEYFAL